MLDKRQRLYDGVKVIIDQKVGCAGPRQDKPAGTLQGAWLPPHTSCARGLACIKLKFDVAHPSTSRSTAHSSAKISAATTRQRG